MTEYSIAFLIMISFCFLVIILCVQFFGLDKRLEQIEKEIKDIKNERKENK